MSQHFVSGPTSCDPEKKVDLPFGSQKTMSGIILRADVSQAHNIALLIYGPDYLPQMALKGVEDPHGNVAPSVISEPSAIAPEVSATDSLQKDTKSDEACIGNMTTNSVEKSEEEGEKSDAQPSNQGNPSRQKQPPTGKRKRDDLPAREHSETFSNVEGSSERSTTRSQSRVSLDEDRQNSAPVRRSVEAHILVQNATPTVVGGNGSSSSPPKKTKSPFTEHEIAVMMALFEINKSPNHEEVQKLAVQLNLGYRSVANFFMNKRAKERKKLQGHGPGPS